jgi:hypothetical protein
MVNIQKYWHDHILHDVLREPHKNPSISAHRVICIVTLGTDLLFGTQLCDCVRNRSQTFLTRASSTFHQLLLSQS